METPTQNNHNSSIPVHQVQELISRMNVQPELKALLTKRLQDRNHTHLLKPDEVDKVFNQLKFERAGSTDAVHLETAHKAINSHFHSGIGTGPHIPTHPSVH